MAVSALVVNGGSTLPGCLPLSHLAEQTDGTGTMLASFAYDSQGVPTSVQAGSDPATAPRYYYVYNGHGDVVALTDATGTAVATYGYDAWWVVTVDTERFANGWHNPYLYDGRDGARYDTETGLYWLAVRAYDPTLGRFLSHDPLDRAPLFFADQPYAYAGNNPLVNVDPSGQRMATSDDAGVRVESADDVRASRHYAQHHARAYPANPCGRSCQHNLAKLEFLNGTLPVIANVVALVVAGIRLFGDWSALQAVWTGWNFSALLKVVPQTLQVGIDLFTVIAQFVNLGAKIFHWAIHGVMQFVNGAIAGLNALMAAYKLWTAGGRSGWFLAGKLLMQSVVMLAKALFTGGTAEFSVVFNGIISMLGVFLHKNLLAAAFWFATTAITTGFQAWSDRLHVISGDTFCAAEGGWLRVSGC